MSNLTSFHFARCLRVLGVVFTVGACAGLLHAGSSTAAAQSSAPTAKQPAAAGGSKILNRTKTKLGSDRNTAKSSSKSAAKDNASKPVGGIKPAGQNRKYADPILTAPVTVLARRDGVQSQFNIAAAEGDLQIGRVLRRPSVDGVVTREDLAQEILARRRENKSLPTIDELRDAAQSDANVAERTKQFEEARQQYLADGYMEGEIDDSRVVFIKTNNWCKFHMVLDDMKRSSATDTVPYYRAPDFYSGKVNDDPYYRSDFVYGADFMGSPGDAQPLTCKSGTCGTRNAKDTRRPVPTNGVDSFVAEVTLDHPIDEGSESAEPLTALEQAQALLKDGDPAGATKQLESIVKEDPEDAETVRLLGLALLRSGKTADGISRIFQAYTLSPALSASPIDADLFNGGVNDVRDMAQRVVSIAGMSKDPDASFVAAVLFQANSKHDVARKMMDKAKEKGLKGVIADELSLSLAGTAAK